MSPSSLVNERLRPVVSAVVPIYNTDPALLDRCLTSLSSQTYPDMEIVCVDDGSNANVASWLDAYCEAKANVRLVHKPNGGVASARNRGLLEAAGQFVCFVDADDFISPRFVDQALRVLVDERADVVYGSIVIAHDDASYRWRSTDHLGRKQFTLAGLDLTVPRGLAISDSPSPYADSPMLSVTNVVGALFQRDMAVRIGFAEGVSQAEDRLFNFEYLGLAERAAFSAVDWYTYDHNVPSRATTTAGSAGAEKLLPTIQTMAGLLTHLAEDSSSAGVALRTSVAVGVAKYVRLLVSLTAGEDAPRAVRTINAALGLPGVPSALSLATASSAQDQVFLFLARRRHARALAALGRLVALRARLRI